MTGETGERRKKPEGREEWERREKLEVREGGGPQVAALIPSSPPIPPVLPPPPLPRPTQRANDLVRKKIHPTSIIAGYRLAMREACKYVDEKLAVSVESLVRLNICRLPCVPPTSTPLN